MQKTIRAFGKSILFDRILLVVMTTAVFGLVFGGFISQRSMQEVRDSALRSGDARQTASEVSQLVKIIADAETGQRGFVITGNQDFLQPYYQSHEKFDSQIKRLQILFQAHPEQQERLAKLIIATEQKYEHMEHTITLEKAGKNSEAIAIIQSGRGKAAMDQIRSIVDQMGDDQKRVIAAYNEETSDIMSVSSKIVLVSSIMAVLVALGAMFLLTRNQKRRVRIEHHLRRSNIDLEGQKDLLSEIISMQHAIAMAGFENEKIMSLLVERSNRLTGAEGTVIELVHGDEVLYHHASGTANQFLGMRIKIEGSFSGLCIREKKTLLCYDSEIDERVNREACRKVNVRSMIVTPLSHQEKVIGVIKCYSSIPGAFTEHDTDTLQLMSGFLASALAKADEFAEKTRTMSALEIAKEQLMVAKNIAEAATKTKSQFLANISHEIRTPLHGILGMSRLLLDTPLGVEQKEYAENVFRAGDNLLNIVNDVLDLSKIEAGKLELEEIDFDLKSLLKDLSKTFQVTCMDKGLTLMVETDPGIPEFLKGDPVRLKQILVNLVGNSVKFTSEGYVKVIAHVRGEVAGKFSLHFEVEDSGLGMKQETVEHLFQEFMQADISTTRKFGGTGLGLSITKKIVEQMDGQIGVRSEIGKGTTFWFTINLKSGEKKAQSSKAEGPSVPMAKKRAWKILIADDNVLNQKIAVKTLEKFGLSSDVVDNGKLAVEALRQKRYDLVLMDCQMPEMDGYEATGVIRKGGLKSDADIPILAMTASAMKDELDRCLRAGMNDYISKPFSVQRFAEALEKWLAVAEQNHKRVS